MSDEWFATRDGKAKYGPFSWAKLRELADFAHLDRRSDVLREAARTATGYAG